jgi:hypothetical protein
MKRLDEAREILKGRKKNAAEDCENMEFRRRLYKSLLLSPDKENDFDAEAWVDPEVMDTNTDDQEAVPVICEGFVLPQPMSAKKARLDESSFLDASQYSSDMISQSLNESSPMLPLKARLYAGTKSGTLNSAMLEELAECNERELDAVWKYLREKGLRQDAFRNVCAFLCDCESAESISVSLLVKNALLPYLAEPSGGDELSGPIVKLLQNLTLKHPDEMSGELFLQLVGQTPLRHVELLNAIVRQMDASSSAKIGIRLFRRFLLGSESGISRVLDAEGLSLLESFVGNGNIAVTDQDVICDLSECLRLTSASPNMVGNAKLGMCVMKVIKSLPNYGVDEKSHGNFETAVAASCSAFIKKAAVKELAKKRLRSEK